MDIFVARQPVFTTQKKIFGYELLFRSSLENTFPDIDGDAATSNVLTNTFFSFGLDEILRGKPGLVNFTRNLILQKTPLFFPKDHIIIEVLENIEPEPGIIHCLEEFSRQGFRIALDDFVYHEKFKPMMDICTLIKFDILATPLHTLDAILEEIRDHHDITLLAEKVETYQQFEQAKEAGFELFQGYFFSKPEIMAQKGLSSNQISKIGLITEAGQTEPNLVKIEDLIKKDVSVSFKLLKLMNSTYFKRMVPIDTIKDAMLLLGMDELKKFISLAVVSDLNSDKPGELIRLSVVRARMCEQIGTVMKTQFSTDELFTIGLFSCIDAILDMPMQQIIDKLSLSEKINQALLGQDHLVRQILSLVAGFERGKWDNRLFKLLKGKKILNELPKFYREALRMADTFFL